MRFSALVFSFFAGLILLFFPLSKASAQISPDTDPGVPKNMHTYTQSATIEVMSAMICQIAGVDIINLNQPCLGVDRTTGKIGFVNNGGGAIGVAGTLIASTYNMPVHFSDYTSYISDNFGFAKKSYAQLGGTSIGFIGLRPVLNLFTIFRNISYLLFVIIFVIVGIAIMLRLRIDPRTVMTIQNQIPKLIIGLVMITFSYAIAGFLIDLMWVGTYFAINTVTPQAQVTNVIGDTTLSAPGFVNDLFGGQDGGILGLSGAAAGSVGGLVGDVLNSPNAKNAIGSPSPTDVVGGLVAGALGFILGFIAGVVAFFIFAIAVLVQLFKLWFALLKCFINVILGVVLAPFWILAGLFPRAPQSVGWGGWLRHMAGNLAPFPAIVFLFLIARTIMDQLTISNQAATGFNPPLLGNVSGANANMYGALIAVGFILAAPGIVEQVKKAFGASGVGGLSGIGTGTAIVSGFVGGSAARIFRRDQYGNAVGPGAVWLANRQNRVTRGFGRLMGWRNVPTIREQAEERNRSAETTRRVREEARRQNQERNNENGNNP